MGVIWLFAFATIVFGPDVVKGRSTAKPPDLSMIGTKIYLLAIANILFTGMFFEVPNLFIMYSSAIIGGIGALLTLTKLWYMSPLETKDS